MYVSTTMRSAVNFLDMILNILKTLAHTNTWPLARYLYMTTTIKCTIRLGTKERKKEREK